MKINSQIKKALLSNGITKDEAKLYLIAVFMELDISCIPDNIIRQVNLTDIFTRRFNEDGEFVVQWNIPLFEGEQRPTKDDNWGWVDTEFRKLFKAINPERDGDRRTCIQRMQWFFSQYPLYRKEDIIQATKSYLLTVNDPTYCKKAQKFIYEGTGQHRTSMLLEWCERIKDKPTNISSFKKMGN